MCKMNDLWSFLEKVSLVIFGPRIDDPNVLNILSTSINLGGSNQLRLRIIHQRQRIIEPDSGSKKSKGPRNQRSQRNKEIQEIKEVQEVEEGEATKQSKKSNKAKKSKQRRSPKSQKSTKSKRSPRSQRSRRYQIIKKPKKKI